MFHISHVWQFDMVLCTFKAIFSEKSCLISMLFLSIYIHVMTVKCFRLLNREYHACAPAICKARSAWRNSLDTSLSRPDLQVHQARMLLRAGKDELNKPVGRSSALQRPNCIFWNSKIAISAVHCKDVRTRQIVKRQLANIVFAILSRSRQHSLKSSSCHPD